jgi:hypothetical protein
MARPKKKTDGEAVVKSKSLFDHIKHITGVQDPEYWSTLSDGDKKTWSSWMVNRFLSMIPEYADTINSVQHLSSGIDPKHYYQVLIAVIPGRQVFCQYIKGKKSLFTGTTMEFLASHYGCSTREIRDVLPILTIDDVKSIYRLYGIEVKDKELTNESS